LRRSSFLRGDSHRSNLAVLLLAQIFFGAAIGLILLLVAVLLDGCERGQRRTRRHPRSAIGVGNCIGPAVGAASLQWMPQYANSGAIAVSALLLLGLGAAGGHLENRAGKVA